MTRPAALAAGWPALFAAAAVGTALAVVGVGADVRALVGPVLSVLGLLVALHDMRSRRIPDRLLVVGALATLAVAATVEAVGEDGRAGLGVLLGAALAATPLLVVHLLAPRTLGFGDVKFAAVAGGLLGVVDWRLAAPALMTACVLALAGSAARLWSHRSIPLGLCLAASALGWLAIGVRW